MRGLSKLRQLITYSLLEISGIRGMIAGGAALTHLILVAALLMVLMAGGVSHAAKLQLFSVKEEPAGVVTITTGVFAGGTPSASDFQLRFDEKNVFEAKEVRPVSPAALETSVILCVDQSGSMTRPQIKQIQEALREVLSKPGPRLNVALWAFDTEVTKLHDFSRETAELTKAVGEISIRSARDGKTKLYEAIELGLSTLRNHEGKGPKHLILITDGEDDGSSITDQVVVNEANAKGITIDAIGYGKVSDAGSELLARLAKNTGGHFVSAKGSEQLSRELNKLFNLPPPRAFDVVFSYKTGSEEGSVNSARLVFTPEGQAPVVQAIESGLSAPRGSGMGVPPVKDDAKEDATDGENGDVRVVLGVLLAVIALFAAYMLSRKKQAPPAPAPPVAPPTRPVSDTAEPAPARRSATMVSSAFPPPGKGRPAAYLDCISGAAKGRQFAIEQTIYRIGSGNENELQVSDDFVSQKHALIKYDSGSLYLSDSGSRNGTFLNDTRLHLTAMVLAPGDEVRVGRTAFRVVAGKGQTATSHDEMDWEEPRVP